MQYARNKGSAHQPDLLRHAMLASHWGMQRLPTLLRNEPEEDNAGYSEMCLNGTPRQCLQWLAPVLRELSQASAPGWLTLIDPPLPVSQKWLRGAGLDPRRILMVRSKQGMDPLELCCDILRLGHSHTVVSWLPASPHIGQRLERAAQVGHCGSLNVRMGEFLAG